MQAPLNIYSDWGAPGKGSFLTHHLVISLKHHQEQTRLAAQQFQAFAKAIKAMQVRRPG